MDQTIQAARRRGLLGQPWLLMLLPALFWAGNAIVGRAVAGQVPPLYDALVCALRRRAAPAAEPSAVYRSR
jgi:hypothetical protein